MFINGAAGCTALPAQERHLHAKDFLILSWDCGAVHQFHSWQQRCPTGYWNRPFFLEDDVTHYSYYTNRFGELQGGYGALLENSYAPLC